MAIRKIRFIGDPCLNKVCKPVQKITPSIETLIEDMTKRKKLKILMLEQRFL